MRLAYLLAVITLALPAAQWAEQMPTEASPSIPEYRVTEPAAELVTTLNLIASERFWPYHVTLTRDVDGTREQPALAAGAMGVLIRVNENSLARIDFGRDGLREVSIASTDLVEKANQVRLGSEGKLAPNLVLALGPRLLDGTSETLAPFRFDRVAEQHAFLLVFADSAGPEFAGIARQLAPIAQRSGLLTVLFPQDAAGSDRAVFERLHALEWRVPFMLKHLSVPYSKTLLPQALTLPAVLLLSAEGRIVYEADWSRVEIPRLAGAIDGSSAR